MIRVWTDRIAAGVLDRLGARGSAYAYEPQAHPDRAVSVTMPVRLASWDTNFGLAPIFDMNLPEGTLREYLSKRFAKAAGTFDDFDLLGIVGRTQIGRIRYSAMDADIEEEVPFQSIDEILRARRGGGLFDYLLEEFAAHSGLSGVQPKVMIRADNRKGDEGLHHQSVRTATHIVKLWEEDKYPELAANEFFCLSAAKSLGLTVPSFELSDDGSALVVKRFDLIYNSYVGFEDFCVLNGFRTAEKYKGGYETKLFKRLKDFIDRQNYTKASEELFKLFALNCAIRNGDAHLKNFGITYLNVNGPTDLAPVYDLVTTVAYYPPDSMALTLNGTTRWPDRKNLIKLGQSRADLSPKKIESILEETADAMSSVAPTMREYFRNSEFEIGDRMAAAWETGIRESLGFTKRSLASPKTAKRKKQKPRIASSDNLVLEFLRSSGGSVIGTQKMIADKLNMPPSTVSASVRRLAERGMVNRGSRRLELVPQEI